MGDTKTIADVELVKVGTWPATTGRVTITAAHLADMVAAEGDPDVRTAPLKLGHTGLLSKLGDSAPAFGYATNLRLADDGNTLVGDLTGIPAALETPVKEGFKQRSAEILWKVTTGAGKAYSAVLDALALLGVQQPAVAGLADLAALYKPATALSHLEAESRTTLSLYDMPVSPDEPTHAERVANQVRWAKSSAAELAALVGIAGLDAVFAAIDTMATPDSRGLLSGAPHDDPDVNTPSSGGQLMPTKTLKPEELAKARTLLGLADDATEEQVTAKLTELGDLVTAGEATDPPAGAGGDAAGDATGQLAPAGAALSAETIAAFKAAGLTVIADGALEQLQADATAGREAHTQLSADRRVTVLDEAQRLGKFGAGEKATELRSTFAARLEQDFDGTKSIIDVLPALVPVGELGNSAAGPERTELSAAAGEQWTAWEDEVFGLNQEGNA